MIIHPQGFGDDVIAWTDQMTFLVAEEAPNCIRLDDPEKWREWAMCIVGSQDRIGQDSPDPHAFATWQEWAERLFLTQDFSG